MSPRRRTATAEPVPSVPPRLLVAPEDQNRLSATVTWTDNGVITTTVVGMSPTTAWRSITDAAALCIRSLALPGPSTGEIVALDPTEVSHVR